MVEDKKPIKEQEQKLTPLASWTRIAKLLVTLDKYWKEHVEIMLVNRGRGIEKIVPDVQKHLAMTFNIARLEVALPRLVSYWRAQGGLENLLPKGEKKNGKD